MTDPEAPRSHAGPVPRPNLYTHQVLLVLQEVAARPFQGDDGLEALIVRVNQALVSLGEDVATARVETFRKLYHSGFDRLVHEIADPADTDLMIERYREHVF